MKRVIIFDFNRTIYNPETKALFKNARFVLGNLRKQGFALSLISRGGVSKKQLIKSLDIARYFSIIIVRQEKSREDFQKILKQKNINAESCFVVGDRVKEEIAIGNSFGAKTIWFKNGKFENESPENLQEQPTYTVNELADILKLIK